MGHEAPSLPPQEMTSERILERPVRRLKEIIVDHNEIDDEIFKKAHKILSDTHVHITPEELVHTTMEQYLACTTCPSQKLVDSYESWKQKIRTELTPEDSKEWAAKVCEWMLEGTPVDYETALREHLGAVGASDESIQNILDRANKLYTDQWRASKNT